MRKFSSHHYNGLGLILVGGIFATLEVGPNGLISYVVGGAMAVVGGVLIIEAPRHVGAAGWYLERALSNHTEKSVSFKPAKFGAGIALAF